MEEVYTYTIEEDMANTVVNTAQGWNLNKHPHSCWPESSLPAFRTCPACNTVWRWEKCDHAIRLDGDLARVCDNCALNLGIIAELEDVELIE